MKDITFLNAIHNLKYSILPPFPPKLADFAKNNRPKGVGNEPEKQAVSLRNGLEK